MTIFNSINGLSEKRRMGHRRALINPGEQQSDIATDPDNEHIDSLNQILEDIQELEHEIGNLEDRLS